MAYEIFRPRALFFLSHNECFVLNSCIILFLLCGNRVQSLSKSFKEFPGESVRGKGNFLKDEGLIFPTTLDSAYF